MAIRGFGTRTKTSGLHAPLVFRDLSEPVEYGWIDPDDDIDPEPPTGVGPIRQVLPLGFIEWMKRDDTALFVLTELEAPVRLAL